VAASEISYSDDERWLEISAVTVRSGARMISSSIERGKRRRSYQWIQIVEATLVVRLACSTELKSGGCEIRSKTCSSFWCLSRDNFVSVTSARGKGGGQKEDR
jgi:hypothetical protein